MVKIKFESSFGRQDTKLLILAEHVDYWLTQPSLVLEDVEETNSHGSGFACPQTFAGSGTPSRKSVQAIGYSERGFNRQ